MPIAKTTASVAEISHATNLNGVGLGGDFGRAFLTKM
jgi:hypothetical protein